MMRRISAVLVGLAVVGCQPQQEAAQKQLVKAKEEILRLETSNNSLQKAAVEQQEQIQRLQQLGAGRLEKIFHVQRIELGRYTGGVDLDGKPGDDAIKVYLRPIDRDGSTLKASGDVTIELYDLEANPKENLIGKYQWSVDEISKQWSGGFITYQYSFQCPWKSGPPSNDEITIRAEFVDYLTGKSFTIQKVCKIDLPPSAQTEK